MLQQFINAAVANPYIKAHFLEDGVPKQLNGHVVKVTTNSIRNAILQLDLFKVSSSQVLASITTTHIQAFFNFFGNNRGYTASTYSNVKQSPHWQAAYDVKERLFEINHKTHGSMWQQLDSTSCRQCGLIMPLRTLTIDHQKAQDGGGDAAIARVFRGLGLTNGPPKGRKNSLALETYAQSVGGTATNAQGDGPPPTTNRQGRYTLNNVGTIYYSVFKEAAALDLLQQACMHHYLNLRPACGPCNSRLRNLNIY